MTSVPAPPAPDGFTSPGTYRRVPVFVRAIRFDGDNLAECVEFMGGRRQAKATMQLLPGPGRGAAMGMLVTTLHGKIGVRVGEWIVRDQAGDYFRCKAHVFERDYRPVGERSRARK